MGRRAADCLKQTGDSSPRPPAYHAEGHGALLGEQCPVFLTVHGNR